MRNKKNGFTLVEILVVIGVISIISGSILMVIVSWHRSWNISKVQMDVQSQARRAMSEITEELSQAGQSTVSIINAANDEITFQLPTDDYAGGVFTWGDQIQYSVIMGPTGINQLWRTNLTTGQTKILASYISTDPIPKPLEFTLNNGIISIQLIIGKTPQGGEDPVTMQLNSRVSLRN